MAGKESERKRVEMEGGGREEAVEEESRKLKVERCKSVGRWTLVDFGGVQLDEAGRRRLRSFGVD